MASSERRGQFALLVALLIVIVVALPTLTYVYGRDQAMFAYIGWIWLDGGLPYRDAWDIKPPGVYAVYALSRAMFGEGMWGIRVLDLAATLLAAVAIWRLARQLGMREGAIAAGAFGTCTFLAFGFWDTAQAESFAAPLVCAYALLLSMAREGYRTWLLAGLCLGLAVLLKSTFVLLLPLVLVAAWRTGGGWSGALSAFAGLAIPLVAAVAYFAMQREERLLLELVEAQAGYARGQLAELPRHFAQRERSLITNGPILMPLAIAAIIGIPAARSRGLGFVLWWLALSLMMVILQGKLFRYQHLPLLPPLALLAGEGIGVVIRRIAAMRLMAARAAFTALLLLIPMAMLVHAHPRYLRAYRWLSTGDTARYWSYFRAIDFSFGDCAAAAGYVRANSKPNAPILVFAFEPAVHTLAGRKSPTRHLSIAPINGERQIPIELRARWRAELQSECEKRPPALLFVVGEPANAGLTVVAAGRPPRRVSLGSLHFAYATHIGKFLVYRPASGAGHPGPVDPKPPRKLAG